MPLSPASSKPLRALLFAGAATLLLSACATNPGVTGSIGHTDLSSMSASGSAAAINQLAARYKSSPRDKGIIITYSAALRSVGQANQAVSVIEAGLAIYPNDVSLKLAYAKALSSAGRFDQALNVIDDAIDPTAPDWNALLVKGAILDQSGQNDQARAVYAQALVTAPNEAAIEANIGMSYSVTNDLVQAEAHLRKAVTMQHATSQIRQNLALVIGLQGRFDEARTLLAAELPPDQVEANMAYIRSLLTQQNRWDLIKKG